MVRLAGKPIASLVGLKIKPLRPFPDLIRGSNTKTESKAQFDTNILIFRINYKFPKHYFAGSSKSSNFRPLLPCVYLICLVYPIQVKVWPRSQRARWQFLTI